MRRVRLEIAVRARAVDDDRFTRRRHEALFFENLKTSSGHFPRTAHEAAELLPANLDLHAVRMRHRVRLLTQIEQRTRDTPRHVGERKVTDLSGGLAAVDGSCRATRDHGVIR